MASSSTLYLLLLLSALLSVTLSFAIEDDNKLYAPGQSKEAEIRQCRQSCQSRYQSDPSQVRVCYQRCQQRHQQQQQVQEGLVDEPHLESHRGRESQECQRRCSIQYQQDPRHQRRCEETCEEQIRRSGNEMEDEYEREEEYGGRGRRGERKEKYRSCLRDCRSHSQSPSHQRMCERRCAQREEKGSGERGRWMIDVDENLE